MGLADSTRQLATLSTGRAGDEERPDHLAVEEPLEIRVAAELSGRREKHPLAVTMRTPGADFELAIGFLLTEGIVPEAACVTRVAYCETGAPEAAGNVVEVTLAPGVPFDVERHRRNVYTTSSCGVCGKSSLESVRVSCAPLVSGRPRIDRATVHELPAKLAEAQPAFARTGGMHAAALFDPSGRLLLVREDVGRHNAVDKVVGALAQAGELPAPERILLVSGRASFELVQKAAVAGVPILAAVGAASTLAAESAEALGLTLIGFVREDRFVVYSGRERLAS